MRSKKSSIKIGDVFGRLTIIEIKQQKTKSGHKQYLCHCSCGAEKIVQDGNLRNGHTKSCGCLKQEKNGKQTWTHGLSEHYLYFIYKSIKQRCNNQRNFAYKNYGARGIKLHPNWANNFLLFFDYIMNELGERPTKQHSLDRINNNGNYEPGNLRWALPVEQYNNRRIFNVEIIADIFRILRAKKYNDTAIVDLAIQDIYKLILENRS